MAGQCSSLGKRVEHTKPKNKAAYIQTNKLKMQLVSFIGSSLKLIARKKGCDRVEYGRYGVQRLSAAMHATFEVYFSFALVGRRHQP